MKQTSTSYFVPPHVYVRYHNGPESNDHLFLHCSFISSLWDSLLAMVNLSWVFPQNIYQFICQWNAGHLTKKKRPLWTLLTWRSVFPLVGEKQTAVRDIFLQIEDFFHLFSGPQGFGQKFVKTLGLTPQNILHIISLPLSYPKRTDLCIPTLFNESPLLLIGKKKRKRNSWTPYFLYQTILSDLPYMKIIYRIFVFTIQI